MLDFDNFKINCSQIADLMGTARGNTRANATEIKKLFNILGKDYGELSEAQKYVAKQILWKEINYDPRLLSGKMWANLAQIYAYEMYGKGKVNRGNDSPTFLEKGNMVEPESIKFLSQIDGVHYEKNDKLFENDWFKGIPDIVIRNENGKPIKIIEVKTSYDLPSFIVSMVRPELPRNLYETMGYMDVTQCKDGEIVHVLVDMPDKIVEYQEKRLRERYEWLEIAPEIIFNRIEKAKSDMQYIGIPDEFKIFRRPVSINGITLRSAKNRVRSTRKWLSTLHNAFTKKQVNLSESNEDQQEDSI